MSVQVGRPPPGPPPGDAVLVRMRRRAQAARIPLAGTFELTTRCNLRCVHCYQGHGSTGAGELSATRITSLVDEAVDAGCLDLLLTGGEPLLRPDFGGIYRHVRERGVLVTVFTNGTLVDDDVVALFRDLPPHRVEVTVHGVTEATFDAVTGVAGSFARCMAGIGRLHRAGARLALKTVMLQSNAHEMEGVENLARSLDAPFRMDPLLCPRLDGDRAPLDQRVPPRTAARVQFADEERRRRVALHLDTLQRTHGSRASYRCDAGVTSFYVTARGRMRPCLMMNDTERDAADEGFSRAWEATTAAMANPAWKVQGACGDCPDLPLCGWCPALFRLESGNTETPIPYLCETGRARRHVILETIGRHPPAEEIPDVHQQSTP